MRPCAIPERMLIVSIFADVVPSDLQSFREALAVLQRQVDELDELKAQHYQEIMEHEEEVWNVVQGKVCCHKWIYV